MNDITQPLVLSVGSHQKGSGRGCAMNVISWENGDTTITDYPECADRFLARVVQWANDTTCTHTEMVTVATLNASGGLDMTSHKPLCPDCSVKVLDLAHRTVGTALPGASIKVWLQIGFEQAQRLAVPGEQAEVVRGRELVRRWLDGDVLDTAFYSIAATVLQPHVGWLQMPFSQFPEPDRMSRLESAHATLSLLTALRASAQVFHSIWAVAGDAAVAGTCKGGELQRAHQIIDRFEELTGIHATPVEPEVTEAAINQMLTPVRA